MDPHIVVRGSGQSRAMPDRAILRLVVDGEGRTRADAYDEAARRAAAVDEGLTRYAQACATFCLGLDPEDLDRTITAPLVVHPKTRWHKGETQRTGWTASRTSSVEVVAFDRLGDLLAELAADGSTVNGPSWQLDPANAAHTEARRLAAEDARRRAEVYAAALGVRLTDVAWVAEPELRGPGPQPFHLPAPALAMRAGGAPQEVIEVAPEELLVDAQVDVGFSFAPIID